MFNLDTITNKNNKNGDKNWSYTMLIIRSSRSGKTNALLNLIQKQNNNKAIDKIYLCPKDLSKSKYQFLIEKRVNSGIKDYNDPTTFINIQIVWMMFTAILITTIQKGKEKF